MEARFVGNAYLLLQTVMVFIPSSASERVLKAIGPTTHRRDNGVIRCLP
jgi:hypothetical protein